MPKSKVRKKRPPRRPAAAAAWQDELHRPPGRRSWGRPAPSRPADFDPWMLASWTLRWTLLTAFVAVCATVVLALILGTDKRDLQAYTNAPACTAGQSVGCRLEIPVTIEDRGQSGSSKSPTDYLDLSGVAPADGQIELPGESALWNVAAKGDNATAIVWNGVVVGLDDNGVEGDTSQAIGVRTVLVEGLLIAAVVCVAVSVIFTTRIAQSRYSGADGWTRILVPLELPALVAPLFFTFGALIGQETESLTTSIAFGAGLTAFASVILAFSWLRHRR